MSGVSVRCQCQVSWLSILLFTLLILHKYQTFYVGGSGGYDDVDEEMDVSKANFLVSNASKLSA